MEGLLPDWARWLIAAPFYGAAYAVAMYAFFWMARRRNFETAHIYQLLVAGSVGGLLGAQIVQWCIAGEAGKTIEGGILGGWLAVLIAKRLLKISAPTGDLFAIAISAGEAVGRIGCFIGGCCYGKAANVAWAVYDHGTLRHPTQLYMSVLAALVTIVLVTLERRRIFENGGLFIIGGMLFCIDRFCIEFFRDAATVWGPFTAGQYGCMIGFALFATQAVRLLRVRAAYSSR